MSTDLAGHVAPETALTADPQEMSTRGRTVLADKVVTKTAAQAALEVDHVHGSAGPLITKLFTSGESVDANAHIDGHLAQLTLSLELDYPAPVQRVTRDVRRHVRERVKALCDLDVTDIAITITALRTAAPPVRRVL